MAIKGRLRRLLSPGSVPGLALFALGFALAWLHLGNPVIAVIIYLVSFGVCCFTRSGWLVLTPTAIVAGHDYPISGSLLVSYGDLFVAAAAASVMLRGPTWKTLWSLPCALLALFAVACHGVLRGWLSLPPSPWNAQLDLYLTQLNALFVFKGYALGTLLAFAFLAEWQQAPTLAWQRLVQGIQLSAVVVSGVVLVERSLAYGVWDYANAFRATGPFMSMHIGGQHIDGYWSLVLPFVLFANPARSGATRIQSVAWIAGHLLVAYAIFATMSRSTIALAVALVLVAILVNVQSRIAGAQKKWFGSLGGVAMLLLFAAAWFAGDAVRNRFAATQADLKTRLAHAQDVGRLASSMNALWGGGLGTYPSAYRQHHGLSEAVLRVNPRTGVTSGVTIQPGCDTYLEQLVNIRSPSPWHVRVRYSVAGRSLLSGMPLNIVVCEKTLLQSFTGVDASRRLDETAESALADSPFAETDFDLDISELGKRQNFFAKTFFGRPVSLAVIARGDQPVHLHAIVVVDSAGNAVLLNGDFREGSRRWFFTSDDHLVWRAKNAWFHSRVELGWTGVLAWMFLIGSVARRLMQNRIANHDHGRPHESRTWERERGYVGVAVLVGWVPMSIFGTLVDTPWILQLLFLLLTAVGANQRWAQRTLANEREISIR